jgi:hypothetical protein
VKTPLGKSDFSKKAQTQFSGRYWNRLHHSVAVIIRIIIIIGTKGFGTKIEKITVYEGKLAREKYIKSTEKNEKYREVFL